MIRLASTLVRLLKGSRPATRKASAHPPPADPKLSLSDEGIHYVDHRGREHRIRWQDITSVLWCEPDYGYGWFGSNSEWVVKGEGLDLFIDDDSSFGKSGSELVQWFAKKLPGFDAEVVEKGFQSGFLGTKAPPGEILKCWSRD